MPQILRPKKVTENSPITNEVNIGEVNVATDIKPVDIVVNNVIDSAPSNTANNIVNRIVPSVEVHDQPTQPEISDALQKLLDMKINKTLANAEAFLEEKEPTILNKVGEVVLAKPNLGKEIRVPKPVEALQIPVVDNQIVNTAQVSAPSVVPQVTPVTPVVPIVTTTNVVQSNNPQPVTPIVQVTQEVPKKSFLDKLLGF